MVVTDHADPLKRPLMLCEAGSGLPYQYFIWAGGRLLGFIENWTPFGDPDELTVAHCDGSCCHESCSNRGACFST
jgi:hypothetical protein